MSEELRVRAKPDRRASGQKMLNMDINWKELLRKRLPIIGFVSQYRPSFFLQDFLAGFTVGLTEIPQGIAYGIVAGLEPQYGLYSGFMDPFVYAVLGSCKDINIGPTAILSLMILPHVEALGPDMAALMTFISGCIIFLLGILQLGFLVEFFSYPVVAGFTSAAALTIAASQIKTIFGISGRANEFLEALVSLFSNLHEIKLFDTVLGLCTFVALILGRQLRNYGSLKWKPELSTGQNVLSMFFMYVSLASNALAVAFGTTLAYCLSVDGNAPFALTGTVREGIPAFSTPPFSTTFENQTYTFMEMAENYGSTIVFLPLVAILESVAIAKAFSKGKTLDATQEMLALGACNILGSCFKSMPVTGSFTRTAVNNASGVRTTLGGTVTGVMVLLALAFLTGTFYYIPKASLAAIIICAMMYLFDYEAIIVLWKTKKIDLIPYFVTLIASLFLGLEYGILIGLATNLFFVLYSSARPPMYTEYVKLSTKDAFVVTLSKSLQFPAAEYIREKIMKECDNLKLVVVVDGKRVGNIDSTVAKNFKVLFDDMKQRGQSLVFWNFKPSIRDVCIGVDEKMAHLFREGSLKDAVDDHPSSRSDTLDYSIQL